MTPEERKYIKDFDAKVRQLIASYQVLKQENNDLYTELESRDAEIAQLKQELKQSQQDYSNLRLAKVLTLSDSEQRKSKRIIADLVREVNKCIRILSSDNESYEM